MQQELTVLNSRLFLKVAGQRPATATRCAFLCISVRSVAKKIIAALYLTFTGKEYGFTVKYLSYKHQSEYLSGRI
ncbi:MAG TPA: hypothetical protein VHZ50_17135 [Puia sp.]|jgi:hypothetical protein|nr:hypothetical protein [Puia sp.]